MQMVFLVNTSGSYFFFRLLKDWRGLLLYLNKNAVTWKDLLPFLTLFFSTLILIQSQNELKYKMCITKDVSVRYLRSNLFLHILT